MKHATARLRAKLYRELAQSEHDAVIHSRREAARYGAAAPGEALRCIADHAENLGPRLPALAEGAQGLGLGVAKAVAQLFSAARHLAVDWLIDAERSYRATLLGLRHGLGVAILLREVVLQQRDALAAHICTELIDERTRLIGDAERELRWFAAHPERSLRSSRRGQRELAS